MLDGVASAATLYRCARRQTPSWRTGSMPSQDCAAPSIIANSSLLVLTVGSSRTAPFGIQPVRPSQLPR